MQSASNLKREIFVRPDILKLDSDTLLQIVKPLYGLSDAGDYWGQTLNEHHLKDLKMEQASGDFSLFFKRIANRLLGLSGTYVDNILRTGDRMFEKKSSEINGQTFDAKPSEIPPMHFVGMKISEQPENGSICRRIDQMKYIDRLKLLLKDTDFAGFRSMRAKLAWVVHSRPDIACAVAFASQITESTYNNGSYKLLNKIIKHLRMTKDICLKFPKLDMDTLQLQPTQMHLSTTIPITKVNWDTLSCYRILQEAVAYYISRRTSPEGLLDRAWLVKLSRWQRRLTNLLS